MTIFGLCQRLGLGLGDLLRPIEVLQRRTKFGAWRQDDGTLDEILELADVTWPVIARENPYRVCRNSLDSSIDTADAILGKKLNESGMSSRRSR